MSTYQEGEESSTKQLCRKEHLCHRHDLSPLPNCYLLGRITPWCTVSPHVEKIDYLHPTKIFIRDDSYYRISITWAF